MGKKQFDQSAFHILERFDFDIGHLFSTALFPILSVCLSRHPAYEEITPRMAAQGSHFALRVRGDSMAPDIKDGDVVIVRKQSDVDTGDIAIVLVNGCDATIKQIKKTDTGIMLIGFNVEVYPPHFYTIEEVEHLPVEVLGKVIESRHKWY